MIVWVERNPAEVWNPHPKIGRMAEASDQSTVAAEIGRDRSMNVDLQLETRVALANIVWDGDGKWRTMANEAFYPAAEGNRHGVPHSDRKSAHAAAT